MSHSLTNLIKSKIFQGNSSPTLIEEDKRKRGKRWGKRRDDRGEEVLGSPTKNQRHSNDGGFYFPMSPLNSIGEESSSSKIDTESETDIPGMCNLNRGFEISEVEDDDDDSDDDETGSENSHIDQEDEREENGGADSKNVPGDAHGTGTARSPEKTHSERKPSKLHILKSKMSIPELSFRPPMLGGHHHPYYHNTQKSLDKSAPSVSQMNSPNSISMSPGSFTTHRPSYERSASGFGSLYKLGSNSSASSPRFFCSPKRSNSNVATNGSALSNTPNSSSNNSVAGALNQPNSGSNLVNSSGSSQHLVRGHARNSSVEMKSVKPQPLSIGRRRSKTLDTCGDHGKGLDNTSELLSSINAHLSSSRSGSVKGRSPSLTNQENGAATAAAAVAATANASNSTVSVSSQVSNPPKFSNSGTAIGGSNNTIGTIPFPTAPVQPQQTPSMSRRGSSIANAFNSFVNLRSFSTASSKGTTTTNNSKLDLPLTIDLPPAPGPDEDETRENYLMKLSPYGNEIGPILTETDDPFKRECLRHFLLHHFDFTDCPLDIAMRILLMFLKLPNETQQIDRLLIEFSNVYYEVQCYNTRSCHFWTDKNQLYFLSFSLLMLHTDYFNPKNRYKMTKNEFISLIHDDKDSCGHKIPGELLSYFYDNITAKEFPKFQFTSQSSVQTIETSESESDSGSLKLYSPVDILRTQSFYSNPDFLPSTSIQTGRTSSNSFSSYLAHVPVSGSGSSTSLAQDDVDIYGHILDNTLAALSLQPLVQRMWDEDYIFELFAHQNKYNKYFSILKEAKGGYLRLHRADLQKLSFPNFEVLNPSDTDLTYIYLKIIQMGEVEELTVNRKFSIVGSASKTMWKKQLGVLTSCGLLMFDHQDWINPQLVKDEHTDTSNYIVDYHSSASVTVESPIPVKGLLAVSRSHKLLRQALSRLEAIGDENESRSSLGNTASMADSNCYGEADEDCTMRLYGSQKAKVWRCSSSYEKDNWIDAINLTAACDGCFIDTNTIPNTAVPVREHDVKEKIHWLQSTGMEKQWKLEESKNLLALYGQTMPICTRTKNELSFHVKQLAVSMEWLVYEIKRSEINVRILEQLRSQFDDRDDNCDDNSVEEEDCTSNELNHDHMDSNKNPRRYLPEGPSLPPPVATSGSLSMSHRDQPFILDEELIQRDFANDPEAIIYEKSELSNGEIMPSY